MEEFSITTRLIPKEYAKVMFLGLYRKPSYIIETVVGLYFIVTIAFDGLHPMALYAEEPDFQLFLGTFLLMLPPLIVLVSLKQLRSNPSFRHGLKYTFNVDGFAVQGLTFKSEFQWQSVIKQKEIDKFLILYHCKRAGSLIDKSQLTNQQLEFIKSKIRKRRRLFG